MENYRQNAQSPGRYGRGAKELVLPNLVFPFLYLTRVAFSLNYLDLNTSDLRYILHLAFRIVSYSE